MWECSQGHCMFQGQLPAPYSIHGEPSLICFQGLNCFCLRQNKETHLSLLRRAALAITFLGMVCILEIHVLVSEEMRKWESQTLVFPQKYCYKLWLHSQDSYMESYRIQPVQPTTGDLSRFSLQWS